MRSYNYIYFIAANGRESEFKAELTKLGLRFDEVEGCYKGVTERSFAIYANSLHLEDLLQAFAVKYEQESYLRIDANSHESELIYTSDLKRESIGKFEQVSESVALASVAYTKINGAYFRAA